MIVEYKKSNSKIEKLMISKSRKSKIRRFHNREIPKIEIFQNRKKREIGDFKIEK